MEPLISVIIPCYNHGLYLDEALESVKESMKSFSGEVIIVNDGSTDQSTLEKLVELKARGYLIIEQINQGLAAARNNGISMARGKFILPLDSDNKLHYDFISKALQIFNSSEDIDIVYGNPFFFGEESGLRHVGSFSFNRICQGNYIDACSIYKKTVWQKNRGYDGEMPAMGHEDWEFWINAYINGFKFHYINDLCFYYRSLPNSMAKLISNPSEDLNRKYIYKKHCLSIISEIVYSNNQLDYKFNYIKKNKLKSVIKIIFNKL